MTYRPGLHDNHIVAYRDTDVKGNVEDFENIFEIYSSAAASNRVANFIASLLLIVISKSAGSLIALPLTRPYRSLTSFTVREISIPRPQCPPNVNACSSMPLL